MSTLRLHCPLGHKKILTYRVDCLVQVFHKDCFKTWMTKCERPYSQCCPYNCWKSIDRADMERRTDDLLSMASGSQTQPQPVVEVGDESSVDDGAETQPAPSLDADETPILR